MTNFMRRLRSLCLLCVPLVLWCPAFAQAGDVAKPSVQQRDGQHDFDFEFGDWKIQLKRRLKPLTGSTTWVEYEGSSVVRRVWNGAANLGEIDVSGAAGHIQGLSLRTYNPQSRQWNITWSNRADGAVGPPMVGEFKNGRGEFYNQEPFNGRAILVRFIFSDITANSFKFEQAFSDDGGKTWEANWVATFARVKE
ncbi:MAG TPA: hypothetical protein VJS64_19050 [Pyrinomonadaceae bacterium]|nr:hypothetical protein [Pyrinomonadaceae bacterium]